MKLEDIGFYTLSDKRAKQASVTSPLARCELLITNRCNFKCPYCRGMSQPSLSAGEIDRTLDLWIKDGLQNVRFSGGEPTLHAHLASAVRRCADAGARVAISTNGSAKRYVYEELLKAGVTDFSVSLDAGCCSTGSEMTGLPGGKAEDAWNRVVDNISFLSDRTYTTAGVVFNERNVQQAVETVLFAHKLGVKDIRVIPSAQFNKALTALQALPQPILDANPILQYRINNLKQGRHVRGIPKSAPNICRLVLDDMAVAGNKHYPCIIYLREGGSPIGTVGPHMREERQMWMLEHNTKLDPICSKNCLDVCVDYNRCACG